MNDPFIVGFLRTLQILKDYLPMIVVGGGWAPFIYYRYLLGDKNHDTMRTRDIDFMVQAKVPVIGAKTVDQLLEEAGLKAVFKSRDIPPLIHYEGDIDGVEVEIEFLADQTGSKPDLVLEVQKGLYAEALRFISIVIENVIEVAIDDNDFMGGLPPLKVKVPTPSAYIFHKGLIFTRRTDRDKKAKDLYYIFDIITGCRQIYPDIIEDFVGLSQKYPAWYKSFVGNISLHFETIGSEGVLWVAEQRPSLAFPDLKADQFKQFILAVFRKFLNDLEK